MAKKTTTKKPGIKGLTNKQLLYGDYDKDGIKNLDDPKPFRKTKNKKPVSEISLTDELRKIETKRSKVKGALNSIVKRLKGLTGKKQRVEYRVKNMPSVVNKLNRKGLEGIGDFGGARVIAKDEGDLKSIQHKIEREFGKEIVKSEDFYAHPKPGNENYKAVHYDLKEGNQKLELQIKTQRIHKITEPYHTIYKTTSGSERTNCERNFKHLMELAQQADKGDAMAKKQFDKLKITPATFTKK